MPREDEFNHVVVTNDKQLHGVEFSPAQNTEFSFHNVKRSGINSQPNNELNEDVQEIKNTRKTRNVLEEDKDLIKQATESSNASAPTTAAPAGSGATTSTVAGASSSAAVAGASTAATSTVAAAGTIVVAAFVVTTAAPIILSQATAALQDLKVSESEVFYELKLTDTLEDERYFVTLSNDTYSGKQEIKLEQDKEYITGSFTDLEPDVEYTFEVIEGDDGSEITRSLLKKSVKTAAYNPVSQFKSVKVFKEANFVTGDFSIQLDFVDEKNIYSNFSLVLTDGEIEYAYHLDKVTTIQTRSLKAPEDYRFYFYGEFSYTFYYTDDGVEKSIQGETFTFTDISGAKSTLDDISIDPNVDFTDNKLSVTLSYTDELENLYAFVLHLSYQSVTGGTNEEEYYLLSQTTPQVVETHEVLPYEGTIFTYYATCESLDGQLETERKTIKFTDPSRFNYGGLTFGYADFEECSIEVTLDYSGSTDEVFALELELIDAENQTSCNATLDIKTETQEALMTDGLDLEHGTFNYILRKYINEDYDYEVLDRGSNITFTDKKGRTSEIKDIIFETDNDGKVFFNSATGTFDVTLDYVDYFNYYQSFALVLSDSDGASGAGTVGQSWTFYLDITNEKQSVEYREYFDIVENKEISYKFQYSVLGNEEQLVTFKEGKITFIDNASPQVIGFEYGKIIDDEGTYYLPFKLTMGDKHTTDEIYLRLFYSTIEGEMSVSTRINSDNTACNLDDYYQLCTLLISENEISDLTSNLVTFDLCYWDEDLSTSDYVSLYSTQGRLELDTGEGFTPLGIRIPSNMQGDMSFAIYYFIYNGTYDPERDLHLKFVFYEDSAVFEDCYFNEDVFPTNIVNTCSLDINDEALSRRLTGAQSFDLYIVYEDSDGVSHEVLCYKDFYFQV